MTHGQRVEGSFLRSQKLIWEFARVNSFHCPSSIERIRPLSAAECALIYGPGGTNRGEVVTPKLDSRLGRRFGVLVSMLWFAGSVAHATQPQKFLTFDRYLTPAQVAAHPNRYVFVWGATNPSLTKAFNRYSPKTLLSAYYPYSRDPDASHGVGRWKSSHPDWMAYRCDGKTPVTMYGDANVALDITIPEVVDWQVTNFLKRPAGVEAVALDNFQFHNDGGTCGTQRPDGKFMKRYGGDPHDMAFAEDTVRWLENISTALHAHLVRVVINHIPDLSNEGDDPDSPLVQRMIGAVDGVLDEHAQSAMRDPQKAALLAKFVGYANAKGKWVYLLYQLDHFDRDAVESAMANYLTMAGPRTAIYVSQRDDTYGREPDFLGLDRSIGEPCSSMVMAYGVISRTYSQGLAIFAPAGQSQISVSIPGGYQNVDGSDAGASLQIAGGHGRVLYAPRAEACTKPG